MEGEFYTIATNQEDNDIYLDKDGNIAFASNAQAVGNVSRNAIRTQMGELQFNRYYGVPYFQTVFIDYSTIDIWKSYVEDILKDLEHIDSINDMSAEIKDSVLSYSIELETDFGEIVTNE